MKKPEHDGERKPIGSVSTYVRLFMRQRRERGEVSVPCGSCTACCRSPRLWAGLRPDEEARFPEAVPVPDNPGLKALPKKADGSCVHLVDDRCAIYARRPFGCRTFDCRAFRVIGFSSASEPVMDAALRQWEEPRLPLAVDKDMRVAFRLARAELRARGGDSSGTAATWSYVLDHYERFMGRARRMRE